MRRSFFLALLAVVSVCSCAHRVTSPSPTPRAGAVAPHGYATVGNAIYDSTGAPRIFHGVNRPSLEWRPDGVAFSAGDFALMRDWKADLVRIPLNQDFWLKGAKQYDPAYEATVDRVVRLALAAGLHVLLDLHWSDRGNLAIERSGQQRMPDANSVEFWKQLAARYRDESHVFFDLYNEPFGVSWEVWQKGGNPPPFTRDDGKVDSAFVAVGMQEIYDAVRGTGARNLVFIGGLDWGYDLTGVPSHRIKGYNIVYSTHPYQWKPEWESRAFFLAQTDPVFMGEFGSGDCGTAPYTAAIEQADRVQASWAAWAWWGGSQGEGICKFPTIVDGWQGKATPMGAVVKAALARYEASGRLPLQPSQ